MTESHRGMVDRLSGYGGASADETAFARAYLAPGDMDPELFSRLGDADRIAAREEIKARRKAEDWAALGHYREANAALVGAPVDVVFIGDSITEMWAVAQPDLFAGGVVGRGVSGQTSAQILLRFMADVVALRPRAVHLMCGVNDIAGNTGPTTPDDYHNTMRALVVLARAHGMGVILGSLTPITALPWAPEVQKPRERVQQLNAGLRDLADAEGLIYADYFPVLADAEGALRSDLTRDGVHPQREGYALMHSVVAPLLNRAEEAPSLRVATSGKG